MKLGGNVTIFQNFVLGVLMFINGLFGVSNPAFHVQRTVQPASSATSSAGPNGHEINLSATSDTGTDMSAAQSLWVPTGGGMLQATADPAISKSTSTVFAWGRAIQDADVDSFFVYPNNPFNYAQDKSRVYCVGGAGDVSTISGVDLRTFSPVLNAGGQQSGYATDTQHVYWGCDVLAGADPASFVALDDFLGEGYVKDKSHVWYVCAWDDSNSTCSNDPTLVDGADPASFEIDNADGPPIDARDKYHTYSSGRVVQ